MRSRRPRLAGELLAGALIFGVTPFVPVQAASAETLLQFYDAALASNPGYRIREYGVDQARGQRDQAQSRLLPSLTLSGNYGQNDFDEPNNADHYSGTRLALQVRQVLFDLTGYFRLRSANANVEQSKHLRAAARMELAADVVDRYLKVLQASDELGYIGAEKAATESEMKRLRVMRERQLAKITDLLEVEAYYQELLTNELEARSTLAVALEELREATGLAATEAAPLARTTFEPVPGTQDAWVADAGQNNGTLVALQQAIVAARHLVNSSRAEYLPQIALVASQVNSDQGVDNRRSPEFDVGSIGIQVTLPLYEGGRVSGSTEEARARWHIAEQQYEQAWRQIVRETRTAYLQANTSFTRIGSTGEQVAALERVVDAQRKSYQLGISTIVDVLVAQRRLLRARADQAKARYDFIRSDAFLRVRAGNLDRTALERIDALMQHGAAADSTQASHVPARLHVESPGA